MLKSERIISKMPVKDLQLVEDIIKIFAAATSPADVTLTTADAVDALVCQYGFELPKKRYQTRHSDAAYAEKERYSLVGNFSTAVSNAIYGLRRAQAVA